MHAERTERRRERVGDHAAHGNDAALSRALGAERVVGRGPLLQGEDADVREIGRGRHEIIGERAGQELSLLVVDETFEEHAAQPLHDGPQRLPVQGLGIDDAPDILHGDVIDHLDVPGARVDRDVCGVRTVAVGALAAREAALGEEAERRKRGELRPGDRSPVGGHGALALDRRDFFGRAAEVGRCGAADRLFQLAGDDHDGGPAHDHAARAERAEAFLHVGGRAVEHAADALHRDGERVGCDLGEHGFQPLAVRRRPGIHGNRSVALDDEPRALPGARGSALDVAADADAVVAAVDQLAVQARLLGPVEFGQAALERHPVVAAVAFGLAAEAGRERVRHLALGDEVAAPELDAIDAEVLCDDVEQPLAEEIGLESAGPAVGAHGRLVGDHQGDVDANVRDAVRPGGHLRDVARGRHAVGAHIGTRIRMHEPAQP